MHARSGANLDAVRRHNLGTLLRHVHEHGPATRAELTTLTGLNRSTVATLVEDLAARGVVDLGPAEPTGAPGRPSPLVSARADGVAALALDVAVDSVGAAVVGLGGRVLERAREPRPRDRAAPRSVVDQVCRLARGLVSGVPGVRVLGTAVSVVGLVADGTVRLAPNLGWRGVALRQMVDERLPGHGPIHVGNEGDLGARAEHLWGAGVGVANLLYLSGEVGIGGGVVVDGRPYSGAAGIAGEVGHLLVDPRGRPCHCGATGCWETEASETALLRRARRDEDAGAEAVTAVLADAVAGRRRAVDAATRTAEWVGLGIGSLANVLDPHRVVLGGFFAALHDVAGDTIVATARRHALADDVDVVPGALGTDAPLLGGAEQVLDAALRDPTTLPVLEPIGRSIAP